jgi:hypothetical protein
LYIGLHVKYSLFLSYCNETRIFSTDFFFEKYISHFMKIRPEGAELFHANGRIDGQTCAKLIVAFCNFANAHDEDLMCATQWLHFLVFHAFASDSPYVMF